jgi:glycine cleavage system aminomethyltransferase T/glycine/D-amino acid oxidase-like deaminating enzyme
MKDRAKLVIIGAGIVGCSAAYHLTQLGWDDIVVIDQGPLFETGGSTSHAPGIVFGTNGSHTMNRFAQYSVKLFKELAFGDQPIWYPVGAIEVAETDARMQEIYRRSNYNTGYGNENFIVSPQEIQDRVPWIDPSVIKGGMWSPHDGVGKAWMIAGAMGELAQASGGAAFYGHTKALDFELEHGRIQAVVTDQGRIECEQVLLCTNIWGSVLSDKLGVTLPFRASSHHYANTEPLPELARESRWTAYPAVRHQDRSMYFKHLDERWSVGSYRHEPRNINPYQVGHDAYWHWNEDDWTIAEADARHMFPFLRGRKYREKVNGMFVFSVDGMPMMGPTQVPGFWTCVGIWVTHSGGAGKTIAEWMDKGYTEWDNHELDISRFHAYQKTQHFIEVRSAQNYREVYDIIHPNEQIVDPRHVRLSPFHARLSEMKGEFFVSAGWERPQWFESNSRLLEDYEDRVPARSGWEARFWNRIQGAEHLATRERAALYELSAFTKIEVSGRGAADFLEWLCSNRVAGPIGKVVYTSMLDDCGGIVCDLTVTRLAPDRFWILTGGGMGPHDLAWINSHAPQDGSVHVADITASYTAVGLWGPLARDILAQLTASDVSNEAFPYFTAQQFEIDVIPVIALRVSYVGELGWELYGPTEFGQLLWDRIWEAGNSAGLVTAGMGAFNSLRMEKGYRFWGPDIHPEINPYEAGIGWAVRLKKGEFLGRDALLEIRQRALTQKLCCLTFDSASAMALGKEPIFAGEECIGFVSSADYGYSVGKHILFALLPIEHSNPGTQLEVQYFENRFKATVSEDVLFDPQMERLKK